MTERTIDIPMWLYEDLISKATSLDLILDMAQDESLEYKITDFCKFLARRQEE